MARSRLHFGVCRHLRTQTSFLSPHLRAPTSLSLPRLCAPRSGSDDMVMLKPDFGPNDSLFPPLPTIKSDAIRIQVFTHRSLHGRPTHIFEDPLHDPSPDNERLEHLGDTVLSLIVTDVMLEMYPTLRVGPSTKVRALVVGNANLASISVRYKLPDMLLLHPAQAVTLRSSTHVQADVFESFIGGLFLDQKLEAVKAWLKPLLIPYIAMSYRVIRKQHGLPESPPTTPSTTFPDLSLVPGISSLRLGALGGGGIMILPPADVNATAGHLALFNQHLQKQSKQVEWTYANLAGTNQDPELGEELAAGRIKDNLSPSEKAELYYMVQASKTTPLWQSRVKVDGEVWAVGRGNTKKAARNEAAKEGLKKMGINV